MAFHLLEKREGFVASLEASDMNRSPNRPTALIQQNEILSSKIELIEKQNLEQQKRLQQLERLVMELSCNRSQVEVLEHRQPNSGQDVNCNGNVMKTNKSFNAGLYSKNNNCVSQQLEHFPKVRTGEPLSNSPHLDEGFPQHKTVHPVICKRIFEKSNISATGTSTTSLEESDSVKPDGKLSNPQQELQMSDDVMSIMEEFDRTARENGLTYSMTPIGSVVGSEDVMENVEATREWSAALKGFSPVREETQVFGINDVTLPSSVFLTPVFQRPAPTLCQYNGQDGPMITPQACLTTPVLLTSEALRAVEKAHDRHRDRIEERPMPFHRRLSSCGNDAKKPQPSYLDLKLRKANPFSNLLNGLRQASNSVECNNSNRDIYCGRVGWSEKAQLHADKTKNVESPFCSPTNSCNSNSSGHIRNWRQSLKLGNLSPSTESNCSDLNTQLPFCSPHSCTSGHIRRWRESLKLTYLSPMPESYCSDLETHASEDDLVVDELVSISVGKGNTATTTTTNTVINTRQRNDSLNSITGLCVPPDLLLDTGMRQVTENEEDFDEIEEENVLTEIAGVFDGDLPLEDSMILTDDGSVSVPLVKFKNEELLSIESKDDVIVKEEEEVEEDIEVEEELAPVESVSQVDKNLEPQEESEDMVKSDLLQTGGVFRNVAELIGNTGKSESLVCKKVKSTQGLQEKTLRVDGKDVKLRAGSIILAVVNEAGGLVPLPQLQVKNPKLSKAFKEDSSIEEEVDVETVCEKSPVLEAGDVDSLLAQFEASEAVNIPSIEKSSSKHKSNSPSTKAVIASNSVKSGRQKSVSSIVPADTSQASPTHQKIKDALPKEIIEKIKASTKRKSTQMLSEPLAMRKGRGGRLQESNQHRSKTHRAPSSTSVQQSSSDQRVPPPLDHDYCFSPDKQKKNKNSSDNTSRSEEYFNKLPDYYTVKVSKGDGKKPINSSDDNHDDNGKKDSGVESGDVSDASVEPEDRRKERTIESGQSRDEWEKGKSENITDGKCSEDIYNKLPSYMTDIGNSKPKDNDAEEREGGGRGEGEKEECEDKEEKREIKKIKRKLNLSEYRQRIQSAQSSRCPSPAQTDVMPKTINNIPLSIGELIQKMKEAEAEKAKESVNSKVPEQKCENSVLPVEDVEEGELKGDSDIEVSTHEISKPIASVDSKIEKHVEGRKENKVPFSSPSSLSSTSTSNSRESRKNSSRVYPSRRWSSSSQSSRSRSRTPSAKKKKKHHSSRSSRSSRGKRRGARRSSRSSVSPCRCCSRSRSRSHSRSRSRSLSRSRGRSSSESSYCSTCSCSSRSRSRSHSSKKRGRRGYSRRYERRRRTRSRSRSSSRYSRSSRRSRSPTWRDINRSRSPSRRPMMPRREDGDRLKQVEERRVIYVGRISDGTTKADLRHRFSKYGVIVDISVHFRDRGDNYGFVTYKNKSEAYSAVENGNSDPAYPRYDLCFGGRRAFCRVQYSDLDAQDDGFGGSGPGSKGRGSGNSDFDSLLRAAMKRKTR